MRLNIPAGTATRFEVVLAIFMDYFYFHFIIFLLTLLIVFIFPIQKFIFLSKLFSFCGFCVLCNIKYSPLQDFKIIHCIIVMKVTFSQSPKL